MPYLIIVILALGIAAAQAGIGGIALLYALPAYGIIGLAALCSLFEPLKRISAGTSPRCLIAAIILGAYVVIRAVYSPVDYLARPDLFMTLAALTVYLLAAIFLAAPPPRQMLLAIFFVFAGAHFACGVVQFRPEQFMFFSPWIERVDYASRASGFYLNPNHLAGLLEALGVMAAALACWSNWRLVARVIAGYTALLCFIGVVLTGSRGGYISTLAGLLVFAGLSVYVVRRLRPAHFWPTVVAVLMVFSAAIGGGGTLMLKSQTLKDRLQQVEVSKNTRLTMWKAAAKQFELSPLAGSGSGTYAYLGKKLRTAPVDRDATHVLNDYLELLGEYGILGVVAMAAFLGIHLWNGIGGLRRILAELDDVGWGILNDELALVLGALSAIAAVLVHSLFDCNLHVPGNTLVVAFLFSILAAPTIDTLLPEESAAPSLTIHWLRFLAPVVGLYLLVVGTPRVEAEFYAKCAEDALRTEDFETAARCAEAGIAVEKKNPNLFRYLAESHYRRALSSEAEADFHETYAADPESSIAHTQSGRDGQIREHLREAARSFQRAVELGDPYGPAASRLAEIRARQKTASPALPPP